MKALYKSLILLLLLWPLATTADPLTDAMMALEKQQMARLAEQQGRPGVVIDAFRTDGCSGGMSEAWIDLADMLPEFGRMLGKKPPWEHCCVTHDRAYWRGETEQGYEKRLLADQQLRACVQQTGVEYRDSLAQRTGRSPRDIQQLFDLAADMMYRAVRLGGGPCSGLDWRWGHGWPECSIFAEVSDKQSGPEKSADKKSADEGPGDEDPGDE